MCPSTRRYGSLRCPLHPPRSRSTLEIHCANLPEGSGYSTSEGVSADMAVLTSGTQIHNLKKPAAVSGEAKGKGQQPRVRRQKGTASRKDTKGSSAGSPEPCRVTTEVPWSKRQGTHQQRYLPLSGNNKLAKKPLSAVIPHWCHGE